MLRSPDLHRAVPKPSSCTACGWIGTALYVTSGFLMVPGCSQPPNGLPGLDGFAIVETVDPHARALADSMVEEGIDVLTWAGDFLLPEDYPGALRTPAGVMAGLMGNDLDRCNLVHHLLSAAAIPSRFAIDGEDCWIEADVDRQVVKVATSRTDTESIPSRATRMTSIPESLHHRVELVERLVVSGSAAGQALPVENLLGTAFLSTLGSEPLTVDYIEEGTGARLRVTLGDAGSPDRQEWLGQSLDGVSRQDLIIRHTAPDGVARDHRRTLFDSSSAVVNQAPDVGSDVHSIWIGAHVVTPLFHDLESRRFNLEDDQSAALRMRAVELLMETDTAAWQLFTNNNESGAVFFDSLRVVIASQEKRFANSDVLVASLDLLANPRRILGNDDPAAMRAALGITDAMVESLVFQRSTGVSALTVPDVFAALFQEEPNDEPARSGFYDDALERLLLEGVTEESLTFGVQDLEPAVRVVLVSGDLVLDVTDEEKSALTATAGSEFADLVASSGDVILPEGPDRGWPVQLYLVNNGAPLDYVPTSIHGESPQTALSTPTGTVIDGQGIYQGVDLTFHAMARAFEALEDPDDADSRRDVADWHMASDAATIIENGSMDAATATLTESKPRVLQWGASRDSFSFYESPLWLAPAVAASIRSATPVECRLVYDRDSVSRRRDVDLTQFSSGRMTIEIDGVPTGVSTITASDEAGEHEITIARRDITRLVLGIKTPAGEAEVSAITTPQELRLRGLVRSYRGSAVVKTQRAYAIGVPDPGIAITGTIGTGWPDGSIDLRVPETANPTLPASVAILVDTSSSMGQSADPGCSGDTCPVKIDVVADAIEDIVAATSTRVELAVWGLPSTFDDICRQEVNSLASWSLDRDATREAGGRLTVAGLTGGTPLTGAVTAAIDEFEQRSRGAARRLIVLADGDNDCDADLGTVDVPDDLVVYTIGIGITDGGDAELQLQDLASRTGGSYTRTTTGDELTAALLALGSLPVPEPETPRAVTTTISAASHQSKEYAFPVDADDVVVYLDEEPDRPLPAAFITIQPGEAFPSDLVSIADEYVARIEEHRAEQDGVAIIMPDRMADIGLFQDAFGWFEVDTETGATTSVTQDGLHAGAAAIEFGGRVAGLWAGAESVLGSFLDCILPGCGEGLDEITANICGSISGDASVWLSVLPDAAQGPFEDAVVAVEAACNTGITIGGLVQDAAQDVYDAQVDAATGAVVGWAQSYLLSLLGFEE